MAERGSRRNDIAALRRIVERIETVARANPEDGDEDLNDAISRITDVVASWETQAKEAEQAAADPLYPNNGLTPYTLRGCLLAAKGLIETILHNHPLTSAGHEAVREAKRKLDAAIDLQEQKPKRSKGKRP